MTCKIEGEEDTVGSCRARDKVFRVSSLLKLLAPGLPWFRSLYILTQLQQQQFDTLL